jgi:hypothetical protein
MVRHRITIDLSPRDGAMEERRAVAEARRLDPDAEITIRRAPDDPAWPSRVFLRLEPDDPPVVAVKNGLTRTWPPARLNGTR